METTTILYTIILILITFIMMNFKKLFRQEQPRGSLVSITQILTQRHQAGGKY